MLSLLLKCTYVYGNKRIMMFLGGSGVVVVDDDEEDSDDDDDDVKVNNNADYDVDDYGCGGGGYIHVGYISGAPPFCC